MYFNKSPYLQFVIGKIRDYRSLCLLVSFPLVLPLTLPYSPSLPLSLLSACLENTLLTLTCENAQGGYHKLPPDSGC